MKKIDPKPEEPAEPVLSETDERLLKYLALIGGAMQEQAAARRSKQAQKSFRDLLREPVVIAALITAVVATGITGIIQWRASEREFDQSRMKSLTDQRLVQYTKFLEQEQALVTRVYSLVGSCTAAGNNLIGLTSTKWQDRPPNTDQVVQVINTYDATQNKWRSEALEMEQLMDTIILTGRT